MVISGVTEQCGALSQSSGLGPLFHKSDLQAESEIALNWIYFLQRYTIFKQHLLTSTKYYDIKSKMTSQERGIDQRRTSRQ